MPGTQFIESVSVNAPTCRPWQRAGRRRSYAPIRSCAAAVVRQDFRLNHCLVKCHSATNHPERTGVRRRWEGTELGSYPWLAACYMAGHGSPLNGSMPAQYSQPPEQPPRRAQDTTTLPSPPSMPCSSVLAFRPGETLASVSSALYRERSAIESVPPFENASSLHFCRDRQLKQWPSFNRRRLVAG